VKLLELISVMLRDYIEFISFVCIRLDWFHVRLRTFTHIVSAGGVVYLKKRS